MNSTQKKILVKLFRASISKSKGVDALVFRADNHECMSEIDELESKGYIERNDSKYYLRLFSVLEIENEVYEAEKLLFLCETLFSSLRSFYLKQPGQKIQLNQLCKVTDLPRRDVDVALSYMIQTQIFGGYTTAFYAKEDSWVQPSEPILKVNSFRESIIVPTNSFEPTEIGTIDSSEIGSNFSDYICISRIQDLRDLDSKEFDFSRLVKICEEINSTCANSNYFAVGALLRVLIDHIPPVFGFRSFKEVASNYGAKSVKESFQHLENGCRKIADGLIHQQIRKKDTLPNFHQINYMSQVDLLLAEIVRHCQEKT